MSPICCYRLCYPTLDSSSVPIPVLSNNSYHLLRPHYQ